MAKTIANVFGLIYIVVGIAGFIPALGGTMGMTPSTLLGVADTNIIHNIVHLIIGFAGVTMGRTDEGAATYCKTFGVILLLIGVLGFFVPNLFGILPIGGNDPWIHLASGVVLAIGGFATAPSGRAATTH
ncbi:MAG TPA: DUF4383 domain-containing protein [Candidatus Eremiobacteraceae bacterium]|nr:DUF4383 domain-containing protein [Candidatus Eremiobacteraceae bacterium]